jgi:hypothetical protein
MPFVITLLSDFGTRDAFAGVMKGVILGIAPEARLVDLTHEIPAQDVTAGALVLRAAAGFFPAAAIHLAVVDPGVGTARCPLLVVTERGLLVGPDNGLLHPAAAVLGVREIRVLDQPKYFRHPVSQTFHGRDVFAPVAAHLAAGVPPQALGSPVSAMTELPLAAPSREGDELRGEVIYVDRFGNLVTNISAADVASFPAQGLSVSVAGVANVPVVSNYAAVPNGAALAILGSWGLLEIAVREGSATRRLGAQRGTRVDVKIRAVVTRA